MDTFKIIVIIFLIILTYQIYQINCVVFKDKVEGFEGATQSLGGVDDSNSINTLAQIARKLMNEGLTVPGSMTVTGGMTVKGDTNINGVLAASNGTLMVGGTAGGGPPLCNLLVHGTLTSGFGGQAAIFNGPVDVNAKLTVSNRDILAELDKLNSHWNGNNLTVDSITSSGEGIFKSPITISTGDSIPLRLVTPGGNQSKILMKGGGKAARFILDGNGHIYSNDNEPNYA